VWTVVVRIEAGSFGTIRKGLIEFLLPIQSKCYPNKLVSLTSLRFLNTASRTGWRLESGLSKCGDRDGNIEDANKSKYSENLKMSFHCIRSDTGDAFFLRLILPEKCQPGLPVLLSHLSSDVSDGRKSA
jgi:hypothetical protein